METRALPFMNKSIGEARKLMSAQKVLERSDNKVLAIKTHAAIRDAQARVPQSLRALRPKLDAHKDEPSITTYAYGKRPFIEQSSHFLHFVSSKNQHHFRSHPKGSYDK